MHDQRLIRQSTLSPPFSSEIWNKLKDFIFRGHHDQALILYRNQLHPFHATIPGTTASIFPSLIKACSYAKNQIIGLQLHCCALKVGACFDSVVSNSLISMYAKFPDAQCARKVFDEMPHRDDISWNAMINCYAQNGYLVESLISFKDMYELGFTGKPELIARLLSTCEGSGGIEIGRAIHGLVLVNGWAGESVFLSTALVDLYLRCHDDLTAFRVFERMAVKNEVSWTAMISGCAANGNYRHALDCFRAMQAQGIKPNRVTLVSILPFIDEFDCSIYHGREFHGYALRHGFDSEIRISSALIHMYSNCRRTRSVQLIFDKSTMKDLVTWSSIIASYSQSVDTAGDAMKLFHQMQVEGFLPNYVTFLAVISACTSLSSPSHGRGVHGRILKSGLLFDLFIGNSLLNMYSKCGCLVDTHQLFKEMPIRDNISWSTVITANGLHGHGEKALQLFSEMHEIMEPDNVTYLSVLSACNHSSMVEEGKFLFNKAVKDKKILLSVEHYACLIDLLGKAGKVEDALVVLSKMPMRPSTRILSSLVSACRVSGKLEIAQKLAQDLVKLEPQNAANYTLLSMVYAESCNWHGLEQVRNDMRLKGLRKSYGYSKIVQENHDRSRYE